MWTSPRYSDGAARQEQKHLQINQVLKLLPSKGSYASGVTTYPW
jgi:hypothetical protein